MQLLELFVLVGLLESRIFAESHSDHGVVSKCELASVVIQNLAYPRTTLRLHPRE